MTEPSILAETCLQSCPCGILVVDDKGVIQKINPALEEMLCISAERWQGKTQDSMANPLFRPLFGDGGLIHISGPGMSQERWLQCTISSNGPLTSRFFVDVTELTRLREESEGLRRQVEELTITDELTGLANQRALSAALNSQVTRSRRYNNPLSLAIVELVDATTGSSALAPEIILASSRYLRDRLRWVDLIARWDDHHFVVLLPETGLEDGRRLITDISDGFDPAGVTDDPRLQSLVLRFGIAEWQKGNDSRLLMERAAQDLNTGRQIGHPATAP